MTEFYLYFVQKHTIPIDFYYRPLSSKPVKLMNRRLIKRKLLRTRISLEQTLKQILNINRKRKFLHQLPASEVKQAELNAELKVLNHLATNQAELVKRYERAIALEEV